MQAQTERSVSIEEIRSQFPALERVHNGYPVAYFDGPGGTQVPRSVVEAMNDYLFNHNANTHWGYPTSDETDALIADSRQAFADFFNASADEVVFGQNMTSLTFHLSRALGRRFEAGDEIIVTELDHHGNIDPWRELEKDRGVVIRVLPVDIVSGELYLDELTGLINPRTKLLAIGAASNAIGTITDVSAACKIARDAGILSFVDAVHYAPHSLIDVRAICCDFLRVRLKSSMGRTSESFSLERNCLPRSTFRSSSRPPTTSRIGPKLEHRVTNRLSVLPQP